MAFFIPAAITAGTSLLGHAMRQRQGGPPSPGQIPTQPIEDRIRDVTQSGQSQFDQMLNVAGSQTGFQSQANERFATATGLPGAFTARNQAMGAQARGQAFSGFVQGRQGRDQMLNQLTSQLTGVNQANVGLQHQGQMAQFQYGQNQINDLLTGIGGAGIQFGSDFQANQQFQGQQQQAQQATSLLQQYLNQQGGWRPTMAVGGTFG